MAKYYESPGLSPYELCHSVVEGGTVVVLDESLNMTYTLEVAV